MRNMKLAAVLMSMMLAGAALPTEALAQTVPPPAPLPKLKPLPRVRIPVQPEPSQNTTPPTANNQEAPPPHEAGPPERPVGPEPPSLSSQLAAARETPCEGLQITGFIPPKPTAGESVVIVGCGFGSHAGMVVDDVLQERICVDAWTDTAIQIRARKAADRVTVLSAPRLRVVTIGGDSSTSAGLGLASSIPGMLAACRNRTTWDTDTLSSRTVISATIDASESCSADYILFETKEDVAGSLFGVFRAVPNRLSAATQVNVSGEPSVSVEHDPTSGPPHLYRVSIVDAAGNVRTLESDYRRGDGARSPRPTAQCAF